MIEEAPAVKFQEGFFFSLINSYNLENKTLQRMSEVLTKETNEELISNIKNGNEEAFSQLYDKYSDALYGLILKIIKQEDLAQDILQECFVKIWEKIQTYDGTKGTLFTWMLNICRNKSIDSLRKTNRTRNGHETMHKDMPKNASLEINPETIGLRDVLNNLSDEKRVIIEYLYFKGYTQKETSDELNIPLGTVKTRSRTAILELKDLFTLILASWISNNI